MFSLDDFSIVYNVRVYDQLREPRRLCIEIPLLLKVGQGNFICWKRNYICSHRHIQQLIIHAVGASVIHRHQMVYKS
jgi:hypothetical protein